MYKLKLCVLALVIGLGGIGYASNLTSQNQAAKQDKTDCCAADSQHDSCGTAKNDGDCCKPGAACCDGGSCCSKHNHSKQAQAKRGKSAQPAKQAKAEGDCCTSGSCCTGGSCCTKHKAHS